MWSKEKGYWTYKAGDEPGSFKPKRKPRKKSKPLQSPTEKAEI